jgi:hypothetical protein
MHVCAADEEARGRGKTRKKGMGAGLLPGAACPRFASTFWALASVKPRRCRFANAKLRIVNRIGRSVPLHSLTNR